MKSTTCTDSEKIQKFRILNLNVYTAGFTGFFRTHVFEFKLDETQ